MNRRSLLTAVGVTTGTLSAGCLSSVGSYFMPAIRPGWSTARNFDTEPHVFNLKVERSGEEVHRSVRDVPPRDGNRVRSAIAECNWESTPGDYTVLARVDTNEWISGSLTEFAASRGDDINCVLADAQYYETWPEFTRPTGRTESTRL